MTTVRPSSDRVKADRPVSKSVHRDTTRDSRGDTNRAETEHGSEVDRDFREWGLTPMGHIAAPYQRANPRNFVHRSCGRKVVHPTEDIAEGARRLTEAATGDGPLHTYECDFCAGWHVGHVIRMTPASAPRHERPFGEAGDRRRAEFRRRRTQRRRPWWLR